MKLMMVDLDGTLFDTREVNYLAYKEAMDVYGFTIDYGYYCNFCNGRHYLDFLPDITTEDKSVLSDIHQRKKAAYKRYLSYAKVNNSLISLIKACRNEYKIALVTTASRENTEDILNEFKINYIFDLILTHEDIAKSKPDPEGFIRAMKYFHASPDDCIIFEDSNVGIQAAEATGATVFVVKGYS